MLQIDWLSLALSKSCLSFHTMVASTVNCMLFAQTIFQFQHHSQRTGFQHCSQPEVALLCREEEQVQKPHLVVVPLSTFPNWQREFALWAPQLNVVPFIGNQVARSVIKQHELYADPSQHKTKAKTSSRNADLQVSKTSSSVHLCCHSTKWLWTELWGGTSLLLYGISWVIQAHSNTFE